MSAVNCAMRSTTAVKVDGMIAEQKDKQVKINRL